MTQAQLELEAEVEAQRLLEKMNYYSDPGLLTIDATEIPYWQEETFYRMVEAELLLRGERIHRNGRYFTSARYQKK